MSGLPERRERVIFQRLKNNFPHYAAKCLRIRPKKGEIIAFELNGVQHEIHARLERQLAETGRMRALILKARQPGCSTYVEGRYYWNGFAGCPVQAAGYIPEHRHVLRLEIASLDRAQSRVHRHGLVQQAHEHGPRFGVRPRARGRFGPR